MKDSEAYLLAAMHYQDPVVEKEEREEEQKMEMEMMEKYRLQKGYTESTICGYSEIEDCPCLCTIS